MIDYDELVASPEYQSLSSEEKQMVKKKYLDDISSSESFQSLTTPEKERVVDHTLFSDSDAEERKKQSESMVIQGIKGVYKAVKPIGVGMGPLGFAAANLNKDFYENLPEAKGTPAKIAEMAGGFAIDAPMYFAGGEALQGVKALSNLGKVRKIGGLLEHGAKTGATMGGVEAIKSYGKVATGEEEIGNIPGSILGATASGAALGVGGEVAGAMGGRIAEKFAPEYINLAKKTASALGMGSTMATMAPSGDKTAQFLFGTGLGIVMSGGNKDPRADIYKVIKENLDFARTKGLRPSVVGKRTQWQKERFEKSFDNIANEIIKKQDEFIGLDEEGNPKKSGLPQGMSDYAKRVDSLRREAGQKMTDIAIAEGKKGNILNTDEIVSKIIKPVLEEGAKGEASPELWRVASDWSKRFADLGDITPVQAENLISELNSECNRYFRAGYFGARTPASFLNNLRGNLRSSLIKSIESSKGSKEYETWRQKWADTTSLLNDAQHRATVAGRASPKGFFDLGDMFSASEGIRGGLRILSGDIAGGASDIARGASIYAVKKWIKNLNNSDVIIRKTFQNVDALQKRAEAIGSSQKTVKDLFTYLRNVPRESRQRIFQENPEFAYDLKEVLKPMTSISYQKGKGITRAIGYSEKKLLENKSNIIPLESGIMYKKAPPMKAEIQPGASQLKVFVQELWEDLNAKIKSEKGSIRIGSGGDEQQSGFIKNIRKSNKADITDEFGDPIRKTSYDLETGDYYRALGSGNHYDYIPNKRADKSVRIIIDPNNKYFGTRAYSSNDVYRKYINQEISKKEFDRLSMEAQEKAAKDFIKQNPEFKDKWIPNVGGYLTTGERLNVTEPLPEKGGRTAAEFVKKISLNEVMDRAKLNKQIRSINKPLSLEKIGYSINKKILDKIDNSWEKGKERAGWYKDVADEIIKRNPNYEDAIRDAKIFAVTSAGSPVQQNVGYIYKAVNQAKSGIPIEDIETGRRPETIKNKVQPILKGENIEKLGDDKITNYFESIKFHIDKSFGKETTPPSGTVLDLWMHRIFEAPHSGLDQQGKPLERFTKAQYRYFDEALKTIAKSKGVDPTEFQAGVWVGYQESIGVKTPPAKEAFGRLSSKVNFEVASKDTEGMSPEQVNMISHIVKNIITEPTGHLSILKELGISHTPIISDKGIWQGNENVSYGITIPRSSVNEIRPYDMQVSELSASIIGKMLNQTDVLISAKSNEGHNALFVKLENPLTQEQELDLAKVMVDNGYPAGTFDSIKNGLTIIDMFPEEGKDLKNNLENAILNWAKKNNIPIFPKTDISNGSFEYYKDGGKLVNESTYEKTIRSDRRGQSILERIEGINTAIRNSIRICKESFRGNPSLQGIPRETIQRIISEAKSYLEKNKKQLKE